jgi:hypothetical protein
MGHKEQPNLFSLFAGQLYPSGFTIHPSESPPGQTIDDQFESFHAANPHVYEAIRLLALRTKRAGRSQYGMAGLFEVLRWTHTIETHGDDFKLNNNYRALYARLLMKNEPELDGFFKLRERTSVSSKNTQESIDEGNSN